jgi:hypothetical protein
LRNSAVYAANHKKNDIEGILRYAQNRWEAPLSNLSIEQVHIPFYKMSNATVRIQSEDVYPSDDYPSSGNSSIECPSNEQVFPVTSKSLIERIYEGFDYHPEVIKLLMKYYETEDCIQSEPALENDFKVVPVTKETAIDKYEECAGDLVISKLVGNLENTDNEDAMSASDIMYSVDPLQFSIQYKPVFICKYAVNKMEFYKLVDGCNGEVRGEKIYDFIKVWFLSVVPMNIMFGSMSVPISSAFVANVISILVAIIADDMCARKKGYISDPRNMQKSILYKSQNELKLPCDRLEILGIYDDTNVTHDLLRKGYDAQIDNVNKDLLCHTERLDLLNVTYRDLILMMKSFALFGHK